MIYFVQERDTVAKYRVVETCKATVRTTYVVEAESAEKAELMVRCGNAGEEEDEDVYDHQYPEYETEEVELA